LRIAVLLELERFEQVKSACDAYLARGAPTAEIHRLRGLSRVAASDFPGAIDDYTRSMVLKPARPSTVRRQRGWAYLFAEAPKLALHLGVGPAPGWCSSCHPSVKTVRPRFAAGAPS